MLIMIETYAFRDLDDAVRQPKVRMKARAIAVLKAMRRPWPAALFEAYMSRRMPVARRIDRSAFRMRRGEPAVEHRNDLVAFRDGQCAGQKSF